MRHARHREGMHLTQARLRAHMANDPEPPAGLMHALWVKAAMGDFHRTGPQAWQPGPCGQVVVPADQGYNALAHQNAIFTPSVMLRPISGAALLMNEVCEYARRSVRLLPFTYTCQGWPPARWPL